MHAFLHIGIKMRVVNKCFLYQFRQYARPILFQQPKFLYSSTCHFYQRIQVRSALVTPHHVFLKHSHTTIITVWHNMLQMVAVRGLHKTKWEWQETHQVHSQNQHAQFLTCTKTCTFFSGIWHHAVCQMGTNYLEELMFRIWTQPFPVWNVATHLPNYTASLSVTLSSWYPHANLKPQTYNFVRLLDDWVSVLYTGCHRRKGPNFGRLFLMLNYTDITQNTYTQSWTVTEIMAREVWNFDSRYTLTDCQIHIETGRNMWFL